jgi:hypothetical protein
MKVETWLFGAGAMFFIPVAIIYGFVNNWKEPLGPLAIGLTGGMALRIAAYLWVTSRRIDPRPEDDPFGEISQGAGEQGMFAPYSWSPLWLGASCALVFMGLAVGWWMFIVALVPTAIALVLWVFEFYRGEHAH